MRYRSNIRAAVVLFFSLFMATAYTAPTPQTANQTVPRYAKVLIYNTTKNVERRLRLGGYDLQGVTESGDFEAYANDDDCARLTNEGFMWIETIHDMSAYFVQRFHDSPTDLMAGYPTVSETLDSLNLYATQHPELVAQPIIIGHSLQNRNIYAIKVTHNPTSTTPKPEVFYNGMIHAREAITHTQLLYFIRYLINNYATSTRVQNILDNRALWFVPIVNPDGVAYNEQTNPNGGGFWRKNRRPNADSTYGVDLNRNFGSHWGYDNFGSTSQTNQETYRGTAAFSEPETQVMRDFQLAHNFRITLDYHSYSNDIIIPMSYRREWSPDHYLFNNLAHDLVDPIAYAVGPVWWSLYPANGDGGEWQYVASPDTAKNFAMVIEIGSATDNFWPTQSRILPLCQQMIETNLKIAEIGGEPRIVLPPPVPRVSSPDTISYQTPISWTIDTPSTINPAVNYSIRATQAFPLGTETFDRVGAPNWNWAGSYVTIDTTRRYSGTHSAKFQYTNSVKAILKSKYPIKINAGDTLSYRIWYNIETSFDYFFTQISIDDGISWYSLPSNYTVTSDPNCANWDYGITGSSSSTFVLAKCPLTQYTNRSAIFRFLFWTDAQVTGAGVWVDDITPSLLSPNPWTVTQDSLASPSYTLGAGTWLVQVRARDAQGDTSAWSIPRWITVSATSAKEPIAAQIPTIFGLISAYPNPFNPSTTIRYSLDQKTTIAMNVYAINGRKVATLTSGLQRSGEHNIVWNGRDDFGVPVATGIYFVRLHTPSKVATMKVVMVK